MKDFFGDFAKSWKEYRALPPIDPFEIDWNVKIYTHAEVIALLDRAYELMGEEIDALPGSMTLGELEVLVFEGYEGLKPSDEKDSTGPKSNNKSKGESQ